MTAWIIYFQEAAVYNSRYIQFHIEEGRKLGIDVKLILVEDLEFGVRKDQWFIRVKNREVEAPDFAICRAIYPLLSRQLECMGIRVFNNSFVSEICNDKARTYQYLAKTGIRMVDSSFYRNLQITNILKEVKGQAVIKAVDGHGGSQVFLIDHVQEAANNLAEAKTSSDGAVDISDEATDFKEDATDFTDKSTDFTEDAIDFTEEATDFTDEKVETSDKAIWPSDEHIIKGLGTSDVVLQPLTGSRHQDLRVYVIGKDIIAGVLRTAKEGFKSNFSLGGSVSLYELSVEERAIIHKIMEQFEFDLVGIDFIIGDAGELIFNEIEDVVGSRMLYQCSDINIVQLYLKHILKEMKEMKDIKEVK